MVKKEFKKIIKEATYDAMNNCIESSYNEKPAEQHIYDLFNHRIEEALEVVLEHKVWGVDKSDPDLHAYWKKMYIAYCAAFRIGYVQRQMNFFKID